GRACPGAYQREKIKYLSNRQPRHDTSRTLMRHLKLFNNFFGRLPILSIPTLHEKRSVAFGWVLHRSHCGAPDGPSPTRHFSKNIRMESIASRLEEKDP